MRTGKVPPDKPERMPVCRRPKTVRGEGGQAQVLPKAERLLSCGFLQRCLRKRRGVFSRTGTAERKRYFVCAGTVYTAGGFHRIRGENGGSVKKTIAEEPYNRPTMCRKRAESVKSGLQSAVVLE